MEEKKSIFKKIHNDGFTWHDSILVIFALFVLLMTSVSLLSSGIVEIFSAVSPAFDFSSGFMSLFMRYASFIIVWLVFVGYCFFVPSNRPILQVITPKKKGNTWKMLLIGLLVGGGENVLGIVAAILNKDIHLYFEGCNFFLFIIMFVAVFIQSAGEEFVCRGFLYERIRRGYRSPWVAVVGNAVMFMILHLMNPGLSLIPIVHLVVVAVFYSLFVYYFDSIWLPMAAHAAWNFTQNIVFGLPNSGIVSSFSAWKLEAGLGQITFFYDPVFGVEGSAFLLIVTIIAFVAVIIIGEKKKRKE